MSLTEYMVSPYLPINPQCHVQENCSKTGLNSRMTAKDSYVKPSQGNKTNYTEWDSFNFNEPASVSQ
jgi:hypothetical protein